MLKLIVVAVLLLIVGGGGLAVFQRFNMASPKYAASPRVMEMTKEYTHVVNKRLMTLDAGTAGAELSSVLSKIDEKFAIFAIQSGFEYPSVQVDVAGQWIELGYTRSQSPRYKFRLGVQFTRDAQGNWVGTVRTIETNKPNLGLADVESVIQELKQVVTGAATAAA